MRMGLAEDCLESCIYRNVWGDSRGSTESIRDLIALFSLLFNENEHWFLVCNA